MSLEKMTHIFDHMCRTCLTSNEILFSIFDKNIPEMNSTAYAVDFLKNFCKIEITPGDKLPDKVCAVCAEEIKRAYAFKIRCERAACTLNKLLEQRSGLQSKVISTITLKKTIPSPMRAYQLKLLRKEVNINRIESPVPLKKLKKKITKKRPPNEINGKSSSDVICIEDEEEIKRVPIFNNKETVLPNITSVEQSIRNIDSVKQSTNAEYFVKEEVDDYNSPVSVILMMKNDEYLTDHKENLQTIVAPNKSSLDGAETPEILIKTEPQIILPPTQDSFICHMCSDIIWGEDNFVDHISKHKIEIKKEAIEKLPVEFNDSNKIKEETVDEKINVSSSEETQPRNLRVCIEDSFTCHICSKAIKGNDNFIGHVLSHSATIETETEADTKITVVKCAEGFKCGECGEICETKKTLILHVRRRHMSNHTCDICKDEFSTFENLCNHRRVVHFSDNHCKFCKKKFGNRNQLDDHIKQTHSKSNSINENTATDFSCEYCLQSFENDYEFKTHLVVCRCKKRPFNCGMCSMSFETDEALNLHMQTHND